MKYDCIKFVACIASMVLIMASTSHAGEPLKCVSPIPVRIVEVAQPAPWPNKSYDSEPFFRKFVTEITAHLSAWQTKEQLCLDNTGSKKSSLLTFEKWPDFTAGNEPLVQPPSFDERPSGGCRVTSPWIDIAFEKKPAVSIRALVRWNPRQFFVDQAILYGKPKAYSGQAFIPYGKDDVPSGVAIPLSYGELSRYAEDYGMSGGDDAYVNARAGNTKELLKLYDELRERRKLLEGRMPPDLAWLFRRIPTHEPAPFTFTDRVRGRMHAAMSYHADDYAKLVIALMDRCVASEGVEKNYPSIRDAADLVSLEKYKMIITNPD